MDFFQLKLTRRFDESVHQNPNPITYRGRIALTESGFVCGYLKQTGTGHDLVKSFVVGMSTNDLNGGKSSLKLVQVYAQKNGTIVFPTSPIFYDLQKSNKAGKWVYHDIRNEEAFYLWKNNLDKELVPTQANSYTGPARMYLSKLSSSSALYPNEKANINNMLRKNSTLLRSILNMDTCTYNFMCQELRG